MIVFDIEVDVRLSLSKWQSGLVLPAGSRGFLPKWHFISRRQSGNAIVTAVGVGVGSVPGNAEVAKEGGAIGSRLEGERIGEAVEANARIVAEGPAVDGEGEAATVAPDVD